MQADIRKPFLQTLISKILVPGLSGKHEYKHPLQHQNIEGSPVILEGNTGLYHRGNSYSIYTGLPTVIGWDWHQKKRRSVLSGPMIDQRIQHVQTIYTGTDLKETTRLLDQHNVQYIYLGALEQIYYRGSGLAKFDQATDLWSLVYQNEQVKIYQVR